jgi:hypothetical protein
MASEVFVAELRREAFRDGVLLRGSVSNATRRSRGAGPESDALRIPTGAATAAATAAAIATLSSASADVPGIEMAVVLS